MFPNTFYRVSVKALIKDKTGRVLVIKENQDTWSLPGGGLDHGEEPVAAVRRELMEELGCATPVVRGLITSETFYLPSKESWLLWIVYRVESGEQSFTPGEGVTDIAYIHPDEIADSDDIFEKMVYKVAKDER